MRYIWDLLEDETYKCMYISLFSLAAIGLNGEPHEEKPTPPYMIGYDIGTTGVKCGIIGLDGRLVSSAIVEYLTYSPQAGWVIQNPEDWWQAMVKATQIAMKKGDVKPEDIEAVACDGQAGGILVVDKNRKPSTYMLYADTRGLDQLEWFKHRLLEKGLDTQQYFKRTGLRWHTHWSISKILWIKEKQPNIWTRVHMILDCKDYLTFKLTSTFSTDYANAHTTMLFDVEKLEWMHEVFDLLDLSTDLFPRVYSPTDCVGEITSGAARRLGLKKGTAVAAGTVDAIATFAGANAFEPDVGVAYVGGGGAWVGRVSEYPVLDPEVTGGTCIPHIVRGRWCIIPVSIMAGANLKWFKEEFCAPEVSVESYGGGNAYQILDCEAEQSPPGSRGLIFLPYTAGADYPYWDPKATGAFVGITLANKRSDFIRSIMEGVAYSLKHTAETKGMEEHRILRFAGGGFKSSCWRQIASDILGMQGEIIEHPGDVAGIGSAICASVAKGFYRNATDAANRMVKIVGVQKPREEYHEKYLTFYQLYKKCYFQLKEIMHVLADIK